MAASASAGPRRARRVGSTETSRWTPPSSTRISTRPAAVPARRRNPRQRGPTRWRHQGERRDIAWSPAWWRWCWRRGPRPLARRVYQQAPLEHTSGRCRPLSLIVTAGQRADCIQFTLVLDKTRVPRPWPGRPHKKADNLAADMAYTNGPVRDTCGDPGSGTIPDKTDSPPPACAKLTR